MAIEQPNRMCAYPALPIVRYILKWREVAVCLLLVWVGVAHGEELVGKAIKIADGTR